MSSGYTGDIGVDGTELDIDGGTFEFSSGGATCFMTGVWTEVIVSGGLSNANMLNWADASTTDIGTLRILGSEGTTTIGAAAILDDVEMIKAHSANLIIAENVTSLDNIVQDSGVITCSAALAVKAINRGGLLTCSAGTYVAIDVEPGGLVAYNSSGTLTTLISFGGLFDGRANASGSVTITNATIHELATIDLQSGLRNFVLTNGVSYKGGIFKPDRGQRITLS